MVYTSYPRLTRFILQTTQPIRLPLPVVPLSVSPMSLSQAQWKGMRGRSANRTHHGHHFDQVISGMQKYLRRREPEKMQYCILEAYSMHEIDAKAAVTNTLNRLLVMAAEELIFAETTILGRVCALAKAFDDNRDCVQPLLQIGAILGEARLCRLPSDIRSWYYQTPGDKLSECLPPPPSDYDTEMEAMESKILTWATLTGHSELAVTSSARLFLQHLLAGSRECFYPMFHVFDLSEKGSKCKVKNLNRSASVYVLWTILFLVDRVKNNCKHKSTIQLLLNLFFPLRREQFQYLVNATQLVLYSDRVNTCSPLSPVRTYTVQESKAIMQEHYESQAMVMDDYVVDKHTSAGRQLGKDTSLFATEGSVVLNEDTEFLIPELRAAYIKARTQVATGPKRSPKRSRSTKPAAKSEVSKSPKKSKTSTKPKAKKEPKSEIWKNFVSKHYEWSELVPGEPSFCNEGRVCGRKGVCMRVLLGDNNFVLKEVTAETQMGMGYLAMDQLKVLLHLHTTNATLISTDAMVRRMDLSNPSFVDNYKVEACEKPVYYLLLREFPGQPIKRINNWENDAYLRREYLRVVLARSVLACSDTNASNIMCDGVIDVFSIDEARVFAGAAMEGRILGQINAAMIEGWRKDYAAGRLESILKDIESLPVDKVIEILRRFGYDSEVNRQFVSQQIKNIRALFAVSIQ